jgi:hypothetical protein
MSSENAAAAFDPCSEIVPHRVPDVDRSPTRKIWPGGVPGENQWPRQRRRGKRCTRVSMCNWQTGEADVDRRVQAAQHVLGNLAPSDERGKVSV